MNALPATSYPKPHASGPGPLLTSIITPARALELHDAAERRGAVAVPDVWVVGTLHHLARDGDSGHQTFLLSSDSTALPCVVFRGHVACIPHLVGEGAGMLVRGTVKRYREGHHRRLEVYEMIRLPAPGAAVQETQAHSAPVERVPPSPMARAKRAVPRSPDSIGIVTSSGSKAFTDILHIVRSRAPWTTILFSPARLRGPEAAASIADAIRRLEAHPCDVVVLTSGGGSVAELAPFSDAIVLEAIAACGKPVVSAIAHADDAVGADLVADLSCATPTLAAVELTPNQARLTERLDELQERLQWLSGDQVGGLPHRIHGQDG